MDWDTLNDALLDTPMIDFNTARVAEPLAVTVDPPVIPSDAVNLRSSNLGRIHVSDLTRQADEVRAKLADHFNTNAEKVYLGGSATETLEFFIRNAPRLRDADTAVTTNREYGSMEKVLQNENYFDEMTWPCGQEAMYAHLFARHRPHVPPKELERRQAEELLQGVYEETDMLFASHITHDTGEVLPVEELCDAAAEANAVSVIDAAQSAFHKPIDYEGIGADLMVGSLHKYGHCLNTLGFGIWDGEPIEDTVHEPEYFLPPLHDGESTEDMRIEDGLPSTIDYNGPKHPWQVAHANSVLSYREELGWAAQYERIEHLGAVAEELLGGACEAPGMVLLDEDKELHDYLQDQYRISTTYKESTDSVRVSLSPFNTELEIGILGRAIDGYHNDEKPGQKAPFDRDHGAERRR